MEVTLPGGALRGTSQDGGAAFLGIPYARPPVGQLRFAAPSPPAPWSGVRDATRFGPVPPQSMLAGGPQSEGTQQRGSDEWLTINVWTPQLQASGLPVMVWIYGGAYMSGSSANPTFDGTRLSREGQLVVVTFNYRLAVEGFTAIDGAPPNRGLLDQVAALQWVRDNIGAFGGDPHRVTLAGQSAGAGGVASLLAMPSAAGLFHHAIVQSLPRPYASATLGRAIASQLAARLDCSATRSDLTAFDPATLVAAGDDLTRDRSAYRDRWGIIADTPSIYCPVVDGDILPQEPWRAISTGTAALIPLLVGHTRDEYRLFLALAGQLDTATAEQTDQALRVFAPGHDAGAYRHSYPDASDGHLYELIHSDWLFRMPSLALARAHARTPGAATFMYEFDLDTVDATGRRLGSAHGSDVPLVFGNFQGGSAAIWYPRRPSPSIQELGRAMRSAWASFVHTGDPGWPAFTPGETLTQTFGESTQVTAYPEQASAELWRHETFAALEPPRG